METRSGKRKSSEGKTKKETEKAEEREVELKPALKKSKSPKKKTSKTDEEHVILEKGLIYFFYRPKTEVENAEGPEDVQKLYLLLWPGAEPIQKDEKEMKDHQGIMGEKEPERLIVIAKKKLPETKTHQKFWGFVEKISHRVEEIDKKLDPEVYTTKTRGERHVAGARPVGEGVYALVRYHNSTHLAYVLELPEEPSTIQKAFNIGKEGSYVLQVKNPEAKGLNFLGDKTASYSQKEMKHFVSEKTGGPLRFATAVPTLLDHEGCEILFIGASSDLKAELGDTGEYIEELEKIDASHITNDKLWTELKMKKSQHPSEPLLKGKWK